VPAFKTEHCREIAYVMRMLCGASETLSAEVETGGIVATFMGSAEAHEGFTTRGTTGQRYRGGRPALPVAQDHAGVGGGFV
jgi:hypothetical protein